MTARPLIVANWKMNRMPSQAPVFVERFVTALGPGARDLGRRVDIAIAPAFPALDRLGQALARHPIDLAAQNVHPEPEGAFTGEVSASMLRDLGCVYVLTGHSERRQIFGEDDADVAARTHRLVEYDLRPILCVGETLAEREAGTTLEVVERQLSSVLGKAPDGLAARLVVAYEPVWAIGTGRTATPEIAQEVHASIRETLLACLGETGGETRILYGGSVKPDNARELMAQPDVNGALVGGASLDPDAFAKIALACLEIA